MSKGSGFDYDLACIGSGPAGQRAAVQAAKLDKRVALIERRRGLGGVSLFTGTIPSKTFREAVMFFTSLGGRFDRREKPRPGSRPRVENLLGRVEEVLVRESDVVENQLARNDVETFWGEASFKDSHTLTIRSEDDAVREITAANILIAVGTIPAPPRGGSRSEAVITSEGVLTLKTLPRTMTVVGAGVIGIEYASMFAALGVEVTVIDRNTRPLEFLDREIVDELVHQMRNNHVVFRFGESVTTIETLNSGGRTRAVVNLESGKRVVSDLVLYAIGRSGATERLNLEAAGLKADKRGRLEVDDEFRTSVPHIRAAGDVIGSPSLAATSSEQGRRTACFIFGKSAEKLTKHFPIGIYSVPEISMVGATEHELTEEKIPYENGLAHYREIARGQILGDDSGMLKLLFHRETRDLLGVHAIGTGATELLHIGQAVLRLDGGLDYFLNTVFNYPTLAECYKVAALDAHNKLNL